MGPLSLKGYAWTPCGELRGEKSRHKDSVSPIYTELELPLKQARSKQTRFFSSTLIAGHYWKGSETLWSAISITLLISARRA